MRTMVAAVGSSFPARLIVLGVLAATACGDEKSPAAPTPAPTPVAPAANRAPQSVGSLAAQTLEIGGAGATIDVSGAFRDPDNDTLTFSASSSRADVATASMSGAAVTVAPVAAGTAVVTVTARDPGGEAATQTIDVTVNEPSPTNRAPQPVGALPDQTLEVGGEPATVDVFGAFRDPDNDALAFAASSSRADVATASMSGATVTIAPVAAGTAVVTVTARDPDGATGTQTIDVTVNQAPNRAPVIADAIEPVSVNGGDIEKFALTTDEHFVDPDSDPLEYSAASSDEEVAIVNITWADRELQYPDVLEITGVSTGQANVSVTATDPAGAAVTMTVSVTVN